MQAWKIIFSVVCIFVYVQDIQRLCSRICSLWLAFPKIKSIFLHSIRSKQYRRRNREWLAARAVFFSWLVFPFMAGPSFYGLSIQVFCNKQHRFKIFSYFSICVASVKLLQSLRLLDIFLLEYCSAGVSELYFILIHYRTIPYLKTIPKYALF